jgi:enoyl-CoA hydratase
VSYQDVQYERRADVARIVMNRPRYRNAQSRRLIGELDRAFAEAAADPEVRVIVLGGAGPSFSAGHDLGTPDEREHSEREPIPASVGGRTGWSWDWYSEPILRWRELPKPTIAEIHGHCIYAGWAVASAMDIVVAADDSLIVPHLAEYFSLPWIVGPRKAREILIRNRRIDATEALALGLVNEVVPLDELEDRTMALAKEIAENDPFTMRTVKGAMNAFEDSLGFRATVRSAQSLNMLMYVDGQEDADAAQRSRVGQALSRGAKGDDADGAAS